MKKSKYTGNQIMAILKENDNSRSVVDLCREHEMNAAMFYRWHSKFSGMDIPSNTNM